MKKIFNLVCLTVVSSMLVACGGVELTPEHIAVERDRQQKEVRVAEEKSKIDKAEMETIQSMSPELQGMAYMGKQMKEMFAMVVDGAKKREMGFYEYSSNIAKQKNDLAKYSIGKGTQLATAGVVGYFTNEALQNAQDKAGDRITTGDGATLEHNRISSKSKTDTNQLGDNNQTGAVDASTTGPDKSSVSTTEVVAPEVPEVVPEGEFVPTEPPAHFDDLPEDIPEVPVE